jgi:hypothetical protein
MSPLGMSTTDLLYQPRMKMMMNVEQSVEWELAGETEILGENPSVTLSTTNPTWPDLGSNPGSHGGKPVTNRLSYGTANRLLNSDKSTVTAK